MTYGWLYEEYEGKRENVGGRLKLSGVRWSVVADLFANNTLLVAEDAKGLYTFIPSGWISCQKAYACMSAATFSFYKLGSS